MGPARTLSIVPGSKSISTALGTYRPPVASVKYTLMRSSCKSLSPAYEPVGSTPCSSLITSQNLAPIWFPHCPACTCTISRIVVEVGSYGVVEVEGLVFAIGGDLIALLFLDIVAR